MHTNIFTENTRPKVPSDCIFSVSLSVARLPLSFVDVKISNMFFSSRVWALRL